MSDIVIVGYPRSGSTWIARTLGDILQSSVGGAFGAKPLCTEGQERPGPHRILQLHLKPIYEELGHALENAYELSVPMWKGEPKLVTVVRDPRDVVVSAKYYWNLPSVDVALEAVGKGIHPLKTHRSWQVYVSMWLDCPVPQVLIRYEDVYAYPDATWHRVLDELGFRYQEHRVGESIERQAFDAKRKQIELDGDGREYGKTIQLKHLRKGKVGDWRNHFNGEQRLRAKSYFGEVAERLGYEL